MPQSASRRRQPFRSLCAGTAVLLFFCAAPAAGASHLERLSPADVPGFIDESNLKDLDAAVLSSIHYCEGLPPGVRFDYGADSYDAAALKSTLQRMHELLSSGVSAADFNRALHEEFWVYRSSATAGLNGPNPLTVSAYYEHSLEARLERTPRFRYPIYARPPGLVDVRLEAFDPKRKGERLAARLAGGELLPYYTREEIDSVGALKGRGLEIAWAKDPFDIFLLQIQGSGWLMLPGGKTRHIRYAGDNGRPFRSIGLSLIEEGRVKKEKFSRQWLVRYLHKQSEKKRQAILNRNPRYVFFEIVASTHQTRGSLLEPLTPERSIATDPAFYPPAAPAWLATQRPIVDRKGRLRGLRPLGRFVLNQDEGGAIKGAGRVDFFAGRGTEAEWLSQKLWHPGGLYFFIRKPSP